ncbi:bud site selection protein 16 [Dendrothele bispora CBS 962.96]|uniref:pyridoxal kinase n=1 Tax=Dendrothele bispora (strain CBS 962.96) TaxID=1314807 RepID=A0A4V4HFH0_DENBC|nr:bud site selection protein 16 [Dendrothele bispora CBS 962.96]
MPDKGRILSIQSHVTFGYVGGKAAVFPLQCLGFDVDIVNSVQFSNHSGYGRFGGTKTSAVELASIFDTLELNELLNPSRLLTGYVPNAEALTAVAELASKLKKQKPDIIYMLDPVMGDSGRLYVAPDVVPVYRRLLSLATVISPNWFEVETLTNIPLKDMPSLRQALTVLHTDYRVPNVTISSIPLQPWLMEAIPSHIRPTSDGPYLLCITSSSTFKSSTDQLSSVHAQCVPLLSGYFSGVGDLFSAMIIGHFDPSDSSLPSGRTPLSHAVSCALTKTHAVLTATHEFSEKLPLEERLPTDDEEDKVEPMRKIRRMKGRELRLIQSMDIFTKKENGDLRHMEPWTSFWEQS